MRIARPDAGWQAGPLQRLTVTGVGEGTVRVVDGAGACYVERAASGEIEFTVGGALGRHEVQVLDGDGPIVDRLPFEVDAHTRIEDAGGTFDDLTKLLYKTMCCYAPDGASTVEWRGRTWSYYVHWILDHLHTAKGMQFFSPHNADLVEMLASAQREDGMIWSFASPWAPGSYHQTAYEPYGYARHLDGVTFVRQPVENHCEYNFVECLHLAWQAGGDDAWMAGLLDSAMRALDYSCTDAARWSQNHQLLKRGYTIDSWDFQADDEYLVKFPLGTDQLIDTERTKFGVFFGDNTGYADACDKLAIMLAHAGRDEDAATYRDRASTIRQRLEQVAWNGTFYTHHVPEDPAVVRDFGVDESTQVAMSNAYSLNRNIGPEKCRAIIEYYKDLSAHLPEGSPGEWYAIYPPFERGFPERWQYMNGGVHGHAAGELALGALEHGFEAYGADILARIRTLGHAGGDMVRFAYTGAIEPPREEQRFQPLDLAASANMSIRDAAPEGVVPWMDGAPGNDMRDLPVGAQTLSGVPYTIADPDAGRGATCLACSHAQPGLPPEVEIAVGAEAGAVYLLHTANAVGPSGVAGAVTFHYEDASRHVRYVLRGKDLCGWWFPSLKTNTSGVGWEGSNKKSQHIGMSWAAIANPHPDRRITRLSFAPALDGSTYAVAAVTLADRMPFTPPPLVSHGGPDNWAGGTCMLALMQGLAGVRDTSTALGTVRLSPRWVAAGVDDVTVCARYEASRGYVSYRFVHRGAERLILVSLTGCAGDTDLRVLLPAEAGDLADVRVDGAKAESTVETVERSRYACVRLGGIARPRSVEIRYARAT